MKNFTLYTPTKIHFGKGQIAKLARDIPRNAKILMTYGGGSIKRNGVYQQVMSALAGYDIHEFAGIEPNPAYQTLLKAVDYCREHKIDYLLAVGGGSVIDGTKFIAAAVDYPDEPWEIIKTQSRNIKSALPMSCVLTLPATGSETNCGAVISRKETGDKQSFMHPLLHPKCAVLDPETTYSLPERQTANGVVDAFVHTLEQYLTYPVDGKIQDRFAEGILLTLIEDGPKVLKNPQDYDARANIMWAATQALSGLIGAGVPQDWATHALGHEITALHGLDHAQTLAIVLPPLLNEKRQQKREKLLQYATRVWNLTEGSEDSRIDCAIEATRIFFDSLGVKSHFSDYQIKDPRIPELISKLKAHGQTAIGEHQDLTLEVSERIYQAAI